MMSHMCEKNYILIFTYCDRIISILIKPLSQNAILKCWTFFTINEWCKATKYDTEIKMLCLLSTNSFANLPGQVWNLISSNQTQFKYKQELYSKQTRQLTKCKFWFRYNERTKTNNISRFSTFDFGAVKQISVSSWIHIILARVFFCFPQKGTRSLSVARHYKLFLPICENLKIIISHEITLDTCIWERDYSWCNVITFLDFPSRDGFRHLTFATTANFHSE